MLKGAFNQTATAADYEICFLLRPGRGRSAVYDVIDRHVAKLERSRTLYIELNPYCAEFDSLVFLHKYKNYLLRFFKDLAILKTFQRFCMLREVCVTSARVGDPGSTIIP